MHRLCEYFITRKTTLKTARMLQEADSIASKRTNQSIEYKSQTVET